MKSGLAIAAILCAGLALSACGDKNKRPTGQVVATVDGEEITAIDLKNELAGFNAPDPKIRREAEFRALDGIVTRKILANAAKAAKVDKTPEFAQQKKRLEEALLVQTWQNRLTSAVPAPNRDEVDKFIAENPNLYGARKIFVVEQIRMLRPNDPAMLEAMRPLKNLTDVEQLLRTRQIRFAKGESRIDALALPPQVTAQLLALPADEIFVLPNQNLLLINKLINVEVVPVTGPAAVNHAQQYLKAQRTQEALRRQFGSTIQAARKDVKFSKAYEPPKPPAKAAPKAKAAPAPSSKAN
jgi:EpsD family peptidyl-prolyl cis-trans isomerase